MLSLKRNYNLNRRPQWLPQSNPLNLNRELKKMSQQKVSLISFKSSPHCTKSLRDRRSCQRRRSKGIYNTLSCLLLLTSRTSSRLLCPTTHHQPSSICCSEGVEMGGGLLTSTLSVTTRDPLSQSSNQRQERSVEDSPLSHGLVMIVVSLVVTPVRICSQWAIRQSTWSMAPNMGYGQGQVRGHGLVEDN